MLPDLSNKINNLSGINAYNILCSQPPPYNIKEVTNCMNEKKTNFIKELIYKGKSGFGAFESYVTLSGDNEALIENVSDVYECNEIMARVKAGRREIIIWGEDLKVKSFVNRSCYVSGKITSVEIAAGGAKKL